MSANPPLQLNLKIPRTTKTISTSTPNEVLEITIDGIRCKIPVYGIELPENMYLDDVPKKFRNIVRKGKTVFNSTNFVCLKKFDNLKSVYITNYTHDRLDFKKTATTVRKWLSYLKTKKIKHSFCAAPHIINPRTGDVDISLHKMYRVIRATQRVSAFVAAVQQPKISVYNEQEDMIAFQKVMLRVQAVLS
jgi:hypothetical protein